MHTHVTTFKETEAMNLRGRDTGRAGEREENYIITFLIKKISVASNYCHFRVSRDEPQMSGVRLS